jgi:hypothetical protein
VLFLVGMFPTGGVSLVRGAVTRRRPTGSRQDPVFVIGIILFLLGFAVDVTRPF